MWGRNLGLKRQCHQRAGYKNSVNEGYLGGAGIPSEVLVAVCVQFCGVGVSNWWDFCGAGEPDGRI